MRLIYDNIVAISGICMHKMTKDPGSQSPLESPNDESCKSKRGRKPSQAKLAMLESKKLFAEKRKLLETAETADTNGRKQHGKRKKPMEYYGKSKKSMDSGVLPPPPPPTTTPTATKLKIRRNKVKNGLDLSDQIGSSKPGKSFFSTEDNLI